MQSDIANLLQLGRLTAMLQDKERFSLTKSSLQRHSIDPALRAKMVDWMIEVITKFDLGLKAFFLSVKLLDKYLQSSSIVHTSSQILLIGTTCMYIACKLENYNCLGLSVFVKQIAHSKVSPSEVIELETQILTTLNFDVDLVVSYDFLALICSMLSVPRQIIRVAENLLILFQLYYDTQYLPFVESRCALFISFRTMGIEIEPEVQSVLMSGNDFQTKANIMFREMLEFNKKMSKYRSALVYRKFELVCSESMFIISDSAEGERVN